MLRGGRGGGVYGDVCESVLVSQQADAVILLILKGNRGTGFSVASTTEGIARRLPDLLRSMANDIEEGIDSDSNDAPTTGS